MNKGRVFTDTVSLAQPKSPIAEKVRNTYIVCMWHFTQHVCLRMEERGFSKGDILQVLNGEVPAIIYNSPQDELVDLYFGQVADKFLMIPVNRKTKAIITIRPMRKKEREIYLNEVHNG